MNSRIRRRQEPARKLLPQHLEALLTAQEYRCGFTDQLLVVPSGADLTVGISYTHWLERLSAENYRRAAVLTRLNAAEPWELGNLLFLCAPWAIVHESYPDLATATLGYLSMATRLTQGTLKVPRLADYLGRILNQN